jgi:hypothetical protein
MDGNGVTVFVTLLTGVGQGINAQLSYHQARTRGKGGMPGCTPKSKFKKPRFCRQGNIECFS